MQISIFYKVTAVHHTACYLPGHQSFLKYKLPALNAGAYALKTGGVLVEGVIQKLSVLLYQRFLLPIEKLAVLVLQSPKPGFGRRNDWSFVAKRSDSPCSQLPGFQFTLDANQQLSNACCLCQSWLLTVLVKEADRFCNFHKKEGLCFLGGTFRVGITLPFLSYLKRNNFSMELNKLFSLPLIAKVLLRNGNILKCLRQHKGLGQFI